MNDKLNKEIKENDNELTAVESNKEEAVVEEVTAEASEQKNEEKKSSTDNKKSIKDYLSKDLFADIKRISFTDGKPSEDDKHEALSDEYQGTFNDISENQIISAKVIGISDSDVMVDIGFKSEGLINRSEFDNKDLPEIGSNIDIFLEKIINKLSPKNILFFDYGYEQKDRSKRKYRSLLRTYKDHHLSVDPILEPGNVDITYDINFSAVIKKLKTLGYESKLSLQKDFLISNGFDEYFDNLQKKLLLSEGMENLKINSQLSGLKALIDSNGLGGFYCLEAKKI